MSDEKSIENTSYNGQEQAAVSPLENAGNDAIECLKNVSEGLVNVTLGTAQEIAETLLPPAKTFSAALAQLILPEAHAGEEYGHCIRFCTLDNGFLNQFALKSIAVLNSPDVKVNYEEERGRAIISGIPKDIATIQLKLVYHVRNFLGSLVGPMQSEAIVSIPVIPESAEKREARFIQAMKGVLNTQRSTAPMQGKPFSFQASLDNESFDTLFPYVELISAELEGDTGLQAWFEDNCIHIEGVPDKVQDLILNLRYYLTSSVEGKQEKRWRVSLFRILPNPLIEEEQAFLKKIKELAPHRVMASFEAISPIQYSFSFMDSYPDIQIETIKILDDRLQSTYSESGRTLEITGVAAKNEEDPKVFRSIELECSYLLKDGADSFQRKVWVPVLSVAPNPQDLWRNLPTDPTAPYQTPNQGHQFISAEKNIIAASKRGRSHAHDGKFRDDNYKIDYLPETGWYLVAVSDGAGSAEFSREGSRIACETFCSVVKEKLEQASVNETLLAMTEQEQEKALKGLVLKAAYQGMVNIDAEARRMNQPRKKYAATLLAYVLKKIHGQWLVVSIGIGDGIIALFNSAEQLTLLSEPDGGEFVGQTRFITMNEVWQDNPQTRLHSLRLPDLKFIMSMTDGVSDPKFETDNNLKNQALWKELWEELQTKLQLQAPSEQSAQALEDWLDFWAKGNHDDRSIVILC